MSTVNGTGKSALPGFPYRLRDLPLAARLVLSVFLIAVGLGYLSALVQLHFRQGSKGNAMPTPDDVVLRFSGKAHWWTDLTTGKKAEPPKDDSSTSDQKKEPDKPDQAKDQPAPGRAGRGSVSDLERLITAPEDLPRDKMGSMKFAFFTGLGKRGDPEAERSQREGERNAILAWIHAPPEQRKAAFDGNEFQLPDDLVGKPITAGYLKGDNAVMVKSIFKARCDKCHANELLEGHVRLVTYEDFEKFLQPPQGRAPAAPAAAPGAEKSSDLAPTSDTSSADDDASSHQIGVEALAQSTHAHLLTFCVLFGFTGLIFAFSSYPGWMRATLAPLVLVVQVLDISCWWLARLEGVGPYFAVAIIGTGGIVGLGLVLQIVLSLFNMYRLPGRIVLAVLMLGAIGAGAAAVPWLHWYLGNEKAPPAAASP
jgi:hypothetical protein